jgi:hypothetical protein
MTHKINVSRGLDLLDVLRARPALLGVRAELREIWLVQLVRLVVRVAWFVLRHPLVDAVAGLVALVWLHFGWPGVVVLASVILAGLVALRAWRPDWFARFVSGPASRTPAAAHPRRRDA